MLKPFQTSQFKRDIKKIKKRGLDLKKLQHIVELLLEEKELPRKNKDHILTGNWHKHRECHIEPDWLLIYIIDESLLKLVRTGTHADLF